MITFTQSHLMHAKPDVVFRIVSDPTLIPKWRTDVPAITRVSGPTEVGTTFLEEVHFMGTKQLLMMVTEFVPYTKLTIEAQQGMAMLPTQSFAFTPEGENTRVELSVSMKVTGVFRLMQFMLPGKMRKIWKGYFEALDKLAA